MKKFAYTICDNTYYDTKTFLVKAETVSDANALFLEKFFPLLTSTSGVNIYNLQDFFADCDIILTIAEVTEL